MFLFDQEFTMINYQVLLIREENASMSLMARKCVLWITSRLAVIFVEERKGFE